MQQITKTKYLENTHINAVNGELLEPFYLISTSHTIDDGIVHLGLSQWKRRTKPR